MSHHAPAKKGSAGIHFSPGVVRLSYVADGVLRRLDEVEIHKIGPDFAWFRPDPLQLDYFASQDLVGVRNDEIPIDGGLDHVIEAVLRQAGADEGSASSA